MLYSIHERSPSPATSQTSTSPLVHRGACKWCLALGVVLLILGLAGAGVSNLLELTSVMIFGPMLLASSLLQFLVAIVAEQRQQRLMHLVSAGAEMVLGFLILAHSIAGPLNLIVAIAVLLVIAGVLRLARGLAAQSKLRGWTIMAGVVALLLGLSIWTGWPSAGHTVVRGIVHRHRLRRSRHRVAGHCPGRNRATTVIANLSIHPGNLP